MLQVLEVELLAPDERQDPAGGADDDVRAVGLEHLLVLRDRQAAEEHAHLQSGKEGVVIHQSFKVLINELIRLLLRNEMSSG